MGYQEIISSILKVLPSLGDVVSWIPEKISVGLSKLIGIEVVPLQAKMISLLIFGFLIYIFLAVLENLKKLVKWGLIILFVIIVLSLLASIFI